MSNGINDKLMDIFFKGENDDWKHGEPDYDLDTYAGLEIEVEPEDVTDINQVTAFTVTEDVMGSISTTFRRRKVVEL